MSTSYAASGRSGGDFAFVLLITCVATLGGFLFGYDSGVINGTVDGLNIAFNADAVAQVRTLFQAGDIAGLTGSFKTLDEAAIAQAVAANDFATLEKAVYAERSLGSGFNVASMLLGCAVGAALAGWLSDSFGRRTMMIVAAVFFIVSAWGSGIAQSSPEFVLYRVLGGLAVGAASVMSPAYISEIAPAHMRGRLSSIQQVAIILGLFMSFLANYLIAQAAGASTEVWHMGFEAWRWMFWMELIPAVVFLIALLTIPESPRFLVAKAKTQAAEGILARVSGAASAPAKVAEIRASLAADARLRFADAFSGAGVFKPIVWVGIGLAVFQQLVGINVIFYYGAVLWQAVGFTEADALLINVLSGGLSILAVLVALALIDRVGRKPLLLVGSIGMAVSLGVMVWAFMRGQLVDGSLVLPEGVGMIALVAANVYVVFFNASWGPVMWVALGEMFPNSVRGSGLAISGFFQWVANFAISMTFPLMLTSAAIGLAGAYAFYAVCAAVSVLFVWFFVRETKGKELEAMSMTGA